MVLNSVPRTPHAVPCRAVNTTAPTTDSA